MRPSLLRLAAIAALTALAGGPSLAQTPDEAASTPRPVHPQMSLAHPVLAGQAAVDALGENLPAAAAALRRSPEALREILLKDRTARIDRSGRLFHVEPLPSAQHVAALQAAAALTADTALPAPLADTFKLHSRGTAKRTIYLDFNGATLTNTAWNNGSTIVAAAFDLDGIPGTFSDTELQRIQYIWQRVAEDYAPFDIDVTTEPPAPSRLTRTDLNDTIYGTTVLITNHTGVYDCSCGGIAYVGVFDDTSDFYKPALVFYDMLAGGDEKDVAEAISHESGHNLGLSHDGTATVGYYAGQGSGATGWAPIMGVGYYQPLVQWSKGEYANANNKEDDIAVIQSNGGPLRPDDRGNTIATASAMTATVGTSTTAISGTGVIERRGDVDVFSFAAGAGAAKFAAVGDARSSNLDISLKLTDAAGNVLARANPLGSLKASISVTLPAAGTYYVWVDGVGEGVATQTGYSDYGSLGKYKVTGTVNNR